MALFGDERRFSPGIRESNGISAVYGKESVGENLGPGLHYERDMDDKRMGWPSSTPSKRQPVRKNTRETERCDSYMKYQLTSSGTLVPHSTDRSSYPSPGQYDPDNSTDYASRMKSTLQKSFESPGPPTSASSRGPSYSMGNSPRMTSTSTVLREGLLVSGGDDHLSSNRGPGSYFLSETDELPATTLSRKSSNVRSSSGNSKGAQAAKSHLATTTATTASPRNTITPRSQQQTTVATPEPTSRRSPHKGQPGSPSYGSPRYAIHTPVLGSPRVTTPATAPFRAAISHKGFLNGGPGGGYGPGVPELKKEPVLVPGGGDQLEGGRGTPTGYGSGRGTPTGLYAATPIRHKQQQAEEQDRDRDLDSEYGDR